MYSLKCIDFDGQINEWIIVSDYIENNGEIFFKRQALEEILKNPKEDIQSYLKLCSTSGNPEGYPYFFSERSDTEIIQISNLKVFKILYGT